MPSTSLLRIFVLSWTHLKALLLVVLTQECTGIGSAISRVMRRSTRSILLQTLDELPTSFGTGTHERREALPLCKEGNPQILDERELDQDQWKNRCLWIYEVAEFLLTKTGDSFLIHSPRGKLAHTKTT